MRVYILLFNARTENEGIHTIQLGDRNYVLMFESEDDATRYALLLEAQDFPSPTVEPIDDDEIKEFCQSANYEWKLIPEGFVPTSPEERLFLVPPETNLEKTDWDPDAKEAQTVEPQGDSEFSDSELEKIRRQLEGLL